ncbi:MAG: sugar transferase [Pseudomonadota bacterium]
MYARYFKRLLDAAVAAVALIVLAPLLAVVAVVLRWQQGAPVLFRQVRPGLHGKPFTMIKFRSMRDDRDPETGELLPDDQRLTSMGKFVRATSIDELPELWNVLCGDMSIVGPRPLLMEYLPRYTNEHARRHEVRPGITGWAQVGGRQRLLFSERLDRDVWYVDNVSASLDMKILWMTVAQALRRKDVILGQDVADVDDLGLNSSVLARRKTELEKTGED